MMHLKILQGGSAHMYVGQKPVSDGNPGGDEVFFDEDRLMAECHVTARYVKKLLGRPGIEGEWVELSVVS